MPEPTTSCLFLSDEAATQRFGRLLAESVGTHDLLLLSGPLGAGKTSLSRTFLRARAGAEIDVPSPTFTLVECYETLTPPVWHADLYRLEDADEIEELGLDEGLAAGIVLVEWPERAGPLWTGRRRGHQLALRLDAPDPARPALRRLDLEGWGSWQVRLPALASGFTSDPSAA